MTNFSFKEANSRIFFVFKIICLHYLDVKKFVHAEFMDELLVNQRLFVEFSYFFLDVIGSVSIFVEATTSVVGSPFLTDYHSLHKVDVLCVWEVETSKFVHKVSLSASQNDCLHKL